MAKLKPIIFNTEMVRAILDGRKKVTRRLAKPQPVKDGRLWRLDGAAWTDNLDRVVPVPCHGLYNKAPVHPGDILYVRETWARMVDLGTISNAGYVYRADFNDNELQEMAQKHFTWKPSIHMPKEAARIYLRVTNVKVERLQTISADECPMEGVWPLFAGPIGTRDAYYKTAFSKLWDSTIKPASLPTCGWEANPWVWAIRFEQISKEEATNGC